MHDIENFVVSSDKKIVLKDFDSGWIPKTHQKKRGFLPLGFKPFFQNSPPVLSSFKHSIYKQQYTH
jgi:hypothetical protein